MIEYYSKAIAKILEIFETSESIKEKKLAEEILKHIQDNNKLEYLIEIIKGDIIELKLWAIQAIGLFEEESNVILEELANEKDSKIRIMALKTLGRTNAYHSVLKFLKIISYDDDHNIRNSVKEILVNMNDKSIKSQIVYLLNFSDSRISETLLEIILEKKSKYLVYSIVENYTKLKLDTRKGLVDFIIKTKSKEFNPVLIVALKDNYKNIVIASMKRLGKLKEANIKRAISKKLKDPDEDIRETASRILRK